VSGTDSSNFHVTAGRIAYDALQRILRVSEGAVLSSEEVELEKCSWPWDPNQSGFKKYKELIESTVVVVISVVLLGGYVTSWDFLLSHVIGALTGTHIAAK